MISTLLLATVVLTAALPDDVKAEFDSFAQRYGKNYGSEYAARLKKFAANVAMIEKVNGQGLGFQLAITKFADQTGDEIAALSGSSGMKPESSLSLGVHKYTGASLPDSIDWTEKGAVTPVKNQKNCGGCWAFATTGALEGAWQIASGNLLVFSEEQFFDCDFDTGDMGCSGGLAIRAFNYSMQHVVCTEVQYPTNVTGWSIMRDCNEDKCTTPGIPKGGVTGFKNVDKSEQALMEAVAQGPVTVGVAADKDIFHLYKKGIIQGAGCGDKVNHAVLLVGYGTDNGVKYWKVKNSWAASWGEEGYVRVVRGSDECGILELAAYPVVKKLNEPLISV